VGGKTQEMAAAVRRASAPRRVSERRDSAPSAGLHQQPSLDWPLSREEKKGCVMRLYERDVTTANDLLRSKDEALQAASDELQVLRRKSSGIGYCNASSSGGSVLDQHGLSATFDDIEAAIDAIFSTPRADGEGSPEKPPSSVRAVPGSVCGAEAGLRERIKSSADAAIEAREKRQESKRGGNRRTAWWAPLQSVWKGAAQSVPVLLNTAAEVSRALADEARQFAGEARSFGEGTQPLPTESIIWRVELDEPAAAGLEVELLQTAVGQPLRPHVTVIVDGLAVDTWNGSKLPVTVRLQPGNREAVMRKITIRPGDELLAVDDNELLATGSDLELRLQKCEALTFVRRILPRKEVQADAASVSRAASGGA